MIYRAGYQHPMSVYAQHVDRTLRRSPYGLTAAVYLLTDGMGQVG